MSVINHSLFSASVFAFSIAFIQQAEAKSTFLPDWQQAGLTFGVDTSGDQNKDENYCKEAEDSDGSKFYHKASGCTKPKVFNETCPTDPNYISKCYCPSVYNKTCTSPYKGDEREKENGYASCDGKYIACCSTICSAGEVGKSCSGTDIRYVAGSNGCGETCYACRPCRNDCNTSCGYNQDSHATGSYSECGQACVTCTDRCSGCECDNSCNSSSGGDSSGSSGGSSGGSSSSSSSSSSGGSSGVADRYIWTARHFNGDHICYSANAGNCGREGMYSWMESATQTCSNARTGEVMYTCTQTGYRTSRCYDTLQECRADAGAPQTHSDDAPGSSCPYPASGCSYP